MMKNILKIGAVTLALMVSVGATATDNKVFQCPGTSHYNRLMCGDIDELNEASSYSVDMMVKLATPEDWTDGSNQKTDDVSKRYRVDLCEKGTFRKSGDVYTTDNYTCNLSINGEGYLKFEQNNGPDEQHSLKSDEPLTIDNEWHHVAITFGSEDPTDPFSAGKVCVYWDDELIMQGNEFGSTTSPADETDKDFKFGGCGSGTNVQFDECRLWKTTLSADEIKALNSKTLTPSNCPTWSDLVLYYDFQDSEVLTYPGVTANNLVENSKYPQAVGKNSDNNVYSRAVVDNTLTLSAYGDVKADNKVFFSPGYTHYNHLQVGNITELKDVNSYSFETMIKMTTPENAEDYRIDICSQGEGEESVCNFYWHGGNKQFWLEQNNGADAKHYINSAAIDFDTDWHHVVVTFEPVDAEDPFGNGKATIYFDDKVIATGSDFAGTTASTEDMFKIGGCSSNTNTLFDECRLWKTALTQDQIVALNGKTLTKENYPNWNDLVLYFNFQDSEILTNPGVTANNLVENSDYPQAVGKNSDNNSFSKAIIDNTLELSPYKNAETSVVAVASDSGVKVYPTIVDTEMNVVAQDAESHSYKISVYNVAGASEAVLYPVNGVVDMGTLGKGMHIISITENGNVVLNTKIIKK